MPKKKQRRKAYDLRAADSISVQTFGGVVMVSIESTDQAIGLMLSVSLASELAHHLQNQTTRRCRNIATQTEHAA